MNVACERVLLTSEIVDILLLPHTDDIRNFWPGEGFFKLSRRPAD